MPDVSPVNHAKVKMPTRSHQEEGWQYHFFGDLVAVSYKLTKATEILTDSSGAKHQVTVYKGGCQQGVTPSIVFRGLRDFASGHCCVEEECSVEGGISAECALELAEHLLDAVAFIQSGACLSETV